MKTVVADASGQGSAGIVRVSLSDAAPLSNHSVVAIVNGEPILAIRILGPRAPAFARMAAQGAAEWQIEDAKKNLIRQALGQKIDETLLVQALRRMLKPEQLTQVDEKLAEQFEKQNQRIMEEFKVNSRIELDKKLSSMGASLSEYEQTFKNQELAHLYIQFKASDKIPVIGRQEIVEYYHAHLDKFSHPARARFQLLMVSFGANGGETNGGKEKAKAKLDAALAELSRGTPFPDVVKRHSDGPRADRGGQHDWYKPGEFNAKEVDAALFELPVGQVSRVFETKTPKAFMVVKVTDREAEGRSSLADVQDEIRATLLTEAKQKAIKDLLSQLRESAVITQYID